jgi:hypothetical protein
MPAAAPASLVGKNFEVKYTVEIHTQYNPVKRIRVLGGINDR